MIALRTFPIILILAFFARTVSAVEPFKVQELRLSRVTLYELGQEDPSDGPEPTFHGYRIKCEWALGDAEIRELLSLLEAAEQRESRETEAAEAEGAVAGGVVGCLSYSFGARFRLPDDRVEDTFIMIACGKLYPAEKAGRVYVNLSEEEADKLRHLIWVSEPCR